MDQRDTAFDFLLVPPPVRPCETCLLDKAWCEMCLRFGYAAVQAGRATPMLERREETRR